MSCNHGDSHLSPRLFTGKPAGAPGAPSQPTDRQSPSAIPGSTGLPQANPDITCPDGGPPTDRPRAEGLTAHDRAALEDGQHRANAEVWGDPPTAPGDDLVPVAPGLLEPGMLAWARAHLSTLAPEPAGAGLTYAAEPPCEAPIEHATYATRCGECGACETALLGIRVGDRMFDLPSWAAKYLQHPTADAGGVAFDPIAGERAWSDAPLDCDGARPTLVIFDEVERLLRHDLLTADEVREGLAWIGVPTVLGPGVRFSAREMPQAACGHDVGRAWPEGVACAACLAEQLPDRLRVAAADADANEIAVDIARADAVAARAQTGADMLRAEVPQGLESCVGRPLPSAARLAPLPWLTDDIGLPIITAATLVDAVAESLEGDREQDAFERARLVLDEERDVTRLIELILGAAALVTAKAAA